MFECYKNANCTARHTMYFVEYYQCIEMGEAA